jgi:hypothetical protein
LVPCRRLEATAISTSLSLRRLLTQPAHTLPRGSVLQAMVVPAALLALVAVLFGQLVIRTGGFPLDDSWIHQVVGRNLAAHGLPYFSLQGQTSGSTSALWPFVVALNHVALPEVAPATYLFVLNVAVLTGIAAMLLRIAVADGLAWIEVSAVAAAAAGAGNFVWLTITGMEHVVFVALVLGSATLALLRPDRASSVRLALGGACLGLAIATRIEAIALVPVFAAVLAVQRRSAVALLLFAAPVAGGTALTLAYNVWTPPARCCRPRSVDANG